MRDLPGGMWQTRHTRSPMRSRQQKAAVRAGTEQSAGMLSDQLFGPGGNTTLEYWIDGRRYGRVEGATAEKAVPFPCAARRSVVLRLAELTCMTTSRGQNEHRPRQLGSRLCGRSARAFAPMRDWSRPSVIFERFLPWSRAACAVAQ